MTLSARQCVEIFHLVLLRALAARGEDKSLFAVKGGCNLRFYFGSIRYSEDMDLDVTVMAKGTLRNKVDRLLTSPAVLSPLRAQAIEITDTSAPKQTETTQRWKAALRCAGVGVVRTKIEFSRRDVIEGASFDAIEREIVRPYRMPPFLATHYTAPKAIAQKIRALAGRTEPQARDVFDLNHLFARPDSDVTLAPADEKSLERAIENAMSISFDDYRSQVVAYLDADQGAPFSSRDAWDSMQQEVVTRLEALA